MQSYVRFILRYRWLVLAVTALITAGSLFLLLHRAGFGTSLGKLLLGESPAFHRYLKKVRAFASDEVIIIAIEDVDVLGAEMNRRLKRAVERIEQLGTPEVARGGAATPVAAARAADDDFGGFDDADAGDGERFGVRGEIARVESVLSAQDVRVRGRTLEVESYADQARAHPGRRGEILARLRDQPLSAGFFVSRDGRHTALIIELVVDEDRSAERGPELVSEALDILVAEGFARGRLHPVGFISNLASGLDETHLAMERIFPFCALLLLIVVFLMFRRLWPVGLAMGVSTVGVIWTMGFSVALDPQINIMMAMVPTVTLIVGFSDVIHLCSAYMLELASGMEREDAIRASAADVGKACIYTSLTTFVGFLGMSFVPTPAFRQLGVVLGFGVAVALLLAVTLVPIAFSLMKKPRPWRVGATSWIQSLLDRLLGKLRALAIGRPWAVITGFAVLLIVAGIGLSLFRIEIAFTKRFSEDSQVRRDARFFADNFIKPNFLDIFVATPEKKGLLDARRFAALAAFQRAVEADPDVARVTSVVDLMAMIHGEFTRGDPGAGRLPKTRDALAQYILMFEMAGGEGLRQMLDFDRRTARISVRLKNEEMRAGSVTGDRLVAMARKYLTADMTVEASGIIHLMGAWLDEIIRGQQKGLGFTFLIIALMMCIGLRSLRIGLWSMVPNTLPLLALGGYLGLTLGGVDSDTLMLAMLAIGIGVDDTIHFLMRFRIETGRTESRDAALERTYDFAGRAIVMTTITLAVGFAPFALSGYYTMNIMGTLLPMTLILALAADLLLVPAMARVGLIRFRGAAAEAQDTPPR